MVKRIHNRTIDDWQQEFRQLRRKVVYGGGNHLMITRPANGTILDVATKYQCYQLGWLVGVHTYEAYNAVHDRVLYLSRIVSSIADAVVLTEGLPSDWQARKLRQFFAEMSAPHEPHKLILDAAHDVVDTIEDHQDWLAETMPSLINNADVKITIHNAVRLARSVRRLMKGQDGGEELKQVLLERGNDSLRSFLQYMHENAPNIGRKQGAVVRDYIIERIRYYRELGCATRGEIYERICKELAKSDAVLRWQKTTERLERRRLESTMEVQAFIRLEEGKLKRAEGADKLREIEVNARRAHARKQRGGKNISTPPLEQKFDI